MAKKPMGNNEKRLIFNRMGFAGQLGKLGDEVESTKEQAAQNKTDIATNKTNIETNKGNITTNTNNISSLTTRLTALETKVDALKVSDIDGLNEALAKKQDAAGDGA